MKARLLTIVFLVALLILAAAMVIMGPDAAGADQSASPSPSPTATTTPEPERASAALVKRALKVRTKAKAARRSLARVRACFDAHPPVRLYPRPKARTAEAWERALRRWTHQRDDWKAKVKAGRHAMRHPGGTSNGTRWKPLLRWTSWPEYMLPKITAIIMRESSGRARALNPSSGAAGLLQFMPQWYRGQWGYPVFNPFDPEANLRAGVWLWRHEGLSPWSL